MRPPTRLVATLMGVGLVFGTAACAPGSGGEQTEGDGNLDPSSFKGKTLDYVYFSDGPDIQATRSAVSRFEQETGARVNLQIVPFDSLEQTLQARINAGDAPEVARVDDWRPYADVLMDFKSYFGKNYDDNFIEGMAQGSQEPDGDMPAVPSDLTMNGPVINVDAFQKAGVPVPSADEPWTWQEMVAAARQVQQANNMDHALAIDKSGHRVSTVLSQYGTTMFNEQGQASLDPAKAGQALGMLNGLMQQGLMSKDLWLEAGSRYEDANEQFLAGEVPVYLSGNWQVGLLAQDATLDWAAAPNPCAERCGGFPGGKFMVAFSESDQPELGTYFVHWMNQTENQRQIDEAAFWMPTRTELVQQGISYPEHGDDMDVFLSDLAQTPPDTYATAFHPSITEAADMLVAEMDKTVAGEQSLPGTLANVQQELEAMSGGTG